MMVPAEEFSHFLRDALETALDDETWLGHVRKWGPESAVSDDCRDEVTCRAIEVLLERSLLVVRSISDADGWQRRWPKELSAQEVVAIIRSAKLSLDPMVWDYSAWFSLSDLGARVVNEARLIDLEEDDAQSTVGLSGRVSVAHSLDGLSVGTLLATRYPDSVGGARSVDSKASLDALFSELTVNARSYAPGDRYLGRLFRLDDDTVVGRRNWSALGDRFSVDVRFPDRSCAKCICPTRPLLTKGLLPYRAPVTNTWPGASLLKSVLVRGLSDRVWLAEVDSLLASEGVAVDDVPDAVFGLVRELLDDGLAMIGCMHAGLLSDNVGFASWELSSDDAVERMRTELLVFGYNAWMWSMCIQLTEKGTAMAEGLVAAGV